MARKSKKTKISTKTDAEVTDQNTIETTEDTVKKQKVTKIVKTPSKPKPAKITPASEASAEIIREAIKATEQKNIRIQKPLVFEPEATPEKTSDPTEVQVSTNAVSKPVEPTDMYSLMLGRYCKVVTEFNLGETKKRPVVSFIALTDYILRNSNTAVFAKFLKFFILESRGIMSNSNALDGIETITDPYVKTKVMTIFAVFNGLAVLKTTGRRPTFSVNAIRSILKNDKFTNWVNTTINT